MIPSILLFNPFEKGFVHSHQRKTKSGNTITIKAHTNKRIAKKVVAKDRIRTPWTKDKTYREVKEKLHTERDSLKHKLEDVRAHKEELLEAKSKGDTHTKRGIKVDHEHHLKTHEKNLHEKLETTNHKIMLHASHQSLQREKIEETREKARTKRQATSKEFKSQSEYMDWYRIQSDKIKDEHKLNKTDGKLIATWGESEKPDTRSQSLKGNKNAWKGGPKDDPKKGEVKKTVESELKRYGEIKKKFFASRNVGDPNFAVQGSITDMRNELRGVEDKVGYLDRENTYLEDAFKKEFVEKKATPKKIVVKKESPEKDISDKERAISKPWTISGEEYAQLTENVMKPTTGLDPSVSLHQLSQMSERAKNERAKTRIAEKREQRKKYDTAVTKWEKSVWDSYLLGKFNANDVFDTDAFYVLSEKIGDKMSSPFKLSQKNEAERVKYLSGIDNDIRDKENSGKTRSEAMKGNKNAFKGGLKDKSPVEPSSDEPDKIVVSDERRTDYTDEEILGILPRAKKEPEIVVEQPKKDWKPKVTEKDGNTHVDYSDEPAGEISIPDFKSTGFSKFTKKDLEMGNVSGPLQDAVNTLNKEKQNILSEYEGRYKNAEEGKKKREPELKGFHFTPPKVDAGYQIINGEAFIRMNISSVSGYYLKDSELPSKIKRRKKTYIIDPKGTKTEAGGSWRDEIKVQKEVYTKNYETSKEDRVILDALEGASGYTKHKFFQKAEYDPETNTIKAEVSTRRMASEPETSISSNLTVPRFLHLLAHHNSKQGGRTFGGGYVIPEKNLTDSVQEQVAIFREDNRAYGERISSSYYEAYLKGRETSFGEKNAKDTLKDDYGVKIKRQNGKDMTSDEVDMLKTVIDHTYNSMGNPMVLRKFAEERGLKISFSGDKNAFLRKAVGLYCPTEATVVVGPGMREVLPHEMTHFIDDVIGNKISGDDARGRGHYASEMQNTSIGKITAEGRRTFTKDDRTKGAYWNRSCEVFARMVEQYAAVNDDKGDLYYSMPAYWKKEEFDKLTPKIVGVLKEHLAKSFSDLFPQKVPSVLLFKAV